MGGPGPWFISLDTDEEDGKVALDVLSSFFDEQDLGVAPEWKDLRLEPVRDFMRKLDSSE